MTIPYLPLGRDATISYNVLDLKFANNREHFILIGGELKNHNLTVYIFGQPMAENVVIESAGYRRVEAPTRYINNPDLAQGQEAVVRQGTPGYYIDSWRVVYRGEEEISREKISADYYPPIPHIYHRGTGQLENELPVGEENGGDE